MATVGEDCEVAVLRLRQTLESCTNLTEAGDIVKCEEELSELVEFLNSVSEGIVDDNDGIESASFEILSEIHQFITCSSRNQAVIDALSFVIPKLAARFGCASRMCLGLAESVVDCFTGMCDSRDMLTILTDALASPGEMFRIPAYFIPLLTAFPKVFVSLRPRRALQQVKLTLPVILKTLKSYSNGYDGDDDDDDDDAVHVVRLFQTMNCIADSIKNLGLTLNGEDSNKLQALLGLFVLQTLAFVSMAMGHELADCLPLVMHLSQLLPVSGLSYTRLITEACIDDLFHVALGDDRDDFKVCFSHVFLGASLTVIWGLKCNEEDLSSPVNELQTSRIKRWEAIGVLKHVFLCLHLPWELKQQTLNFLLHILDGNSLTPSDQDEDCSENATSLYATLQAIQTVLMFAPDAAVRKNAFAAFKKLLADLPTSLRFNILRTMMHNSDSSSSMTGLLLGCVKEEMRTETKQNGLIGSKDSSSSTSLCFWSASALELVELVLRPPRGGPPLLPDNCDAVSAALNLYRFILITESTGKTNYTGILDQDRLKKIHSQWLLPLRSLVIGVVAENDKHGDEVEMDVSCGLNPIQFVLHRCIELTEQHLKH